MEVNSKNTFIKNNKGSTILIVSLVVGFLILGVGGFFGYRWYQNKLLQERIAKIEKVEKGIEDMLSAGRDVFEGEFDVKKLSSYKSGLDKVEDKLADLKKLEVDKDIKDDVKKCTEDATKLTESLRKTFNVLDKVEDILKRANNITSNSQAASLEKEIKALESEMTTIKNDADRVDKESCKNALKETKDLIEKLQEK